MVLRARGSASGVWASELSGNAATIRNVNKDPKTRRAETEINRDHPFCHRLDYDDDRVPVDPYQSFGRASASCGKTTSAASVTAISTSEEAGVAATLISAVNAPRIFACWRSPAA